MRLPSLLSTFSLGAFCCAFLAAVLHHRKRLDGASAPLGSGQMFDAIAPKYDMLNRVMSLGLDASWRRALLQELHLEGGETVFDLATGTADVALLLASQHASPASIVGVDPSAEMLRLGRDKVAAAGFEQSVRLELGDATDLAQYPAHSVDAITMSFGIRNVPAKERSKVVAEAFRLLKPHPASKLAIMEFAEPRGGLMGELAKLFVTYVIPFVGYLGSGDAAAYQHLQRSIADFPAPDDFAALVAGPNADLGYEFDVVARKALLYGVVQIYVARPAIVGEPPASEPMEDVEATVSEPETVVEEAGEPVDLQLAPDEVPPAVVDHAAEEGREAGAVALEEVAPEEVGVPAFDVFAEVLRLEAESGAVHSAAEPGDLAGKEGSHVPVMQRNERVLQVSVPHGMSEEHFITHVYLKNENGDVVAAKAFDGSDDAATLAYEAWGAQTVTPYALCNLHGLWRGDAAAVDA